MGTTKKTNPPWFRTCPGHQRGGAKCLWAGGVFWNETQSPRSKTCARHVTLFLTGRGGSSCFLSRKHMGHPSCAARWDGPSAFTEVPDTPPCWFLVLPVRQVAIFCPRFSVAFHRIAQKDMTKPPRNGHLAAPATDPCQGPRVPAGLHTKGDMGPLGTARSLGSHQGGGRPHRRAPCQRHTDVGARAASEGARWGLGAPQTEPFTGPAAEKASS